MATTYSGHSLPDTIMYMATTYSGHSLPDTIMYSETCVLRPPHGPRKSGLK